MGALLWVSASASGVRARAAETPAVVSSRGSKATSAATGDSSATTLALSPRAAGTTVAVLYLDYGGHDESLTALSKGLTQMLISDLDGVPALRLVERERLEAVLSEQKLGATAKMDARTTARLGKLLGARYLVLGSYFDVLRALRVDARLVDVETGEVVKSVGENGKPDDFLSVEQALASRLRVALEPILTLPRAPVPGSQERPPATPATKRPTPKPPRRLPTSTALAYGRALGALDAGRRDEARNLLRTVVKDQPDFELAQRDLDRLIQ